MKAFGPDIRTETEVSHFSIFLSYPLCCTILQTLYVLREAVAENHGHGKIDYAIVSTQFELEQHCSYRGQEDGF